MLAVAMARMEVERKEGTRKGAWREQKSRGKNSIPVEVKYYICG
jgi:hypothetical protein